MELTADSFMKQLETHTSPAELKKYQRYFKFDDTHPPKDDQFMGVRMGQVFALAKTYMAMPLDQVEKLLESPFHEARVGGVTIMDFQARDKKTSEEQRRKLFDLYIHRHDRINTWDLVDRSAFYVVGSYLLDKPRDVLYKLVHSKQMAERRTAIVSTGQFVMKAHETDDTFKIAALLVHDKDPLIHKAVGWMLRTAGAVDQQKLLDFLDKHVAAMPPDMFSYAIEKLDASHKTHYKSLRGK